MRATGGLIGLLRRPAYAVLRHTPHLRLAIRKVYWRLQQRNYDKLAQAEEIDPHVVFFESYGGRSFGCTPKAIYLQMASDPRFDDYVFIWSFRAGCMPEDVAELDRAILVQRGAHEYFHAIALAGTIIVNNRLPEYVHPKPDQIYVQCWHGTPLKRLGYDVSEMHAALNTASELAGRFGIDARKWTYFVSPSAFATEHLCSAFGLPEERRAQVVIEEGYPRNDELVQRRDDAQDRAALREALGIPAGKKALLYAPTWRDDSYKSGLGYTLDYLVDFDVLRKVLAQEWVVLFRPHYYIANEFDFSAYDGFVLDASRGDINEWYLAADALVTDYSSVMFDFANLRRPILLYVPDLAHYADDIRGFYFDVRKVPGPLCATSEELACAVADLDGYEQRFGEAYGSFVETFCPRDDGHAAERVVSRLFEGRD